MNRRRKREKPDAEIDVGAFADIAFLLIIFFILTTSIMRSTGQEVSLPQAQTPEDRQVDEKTPSVNILADRILFGEDEENMDRVSLEELRSKLFQLNMHDAEDQDRMIIVEVAEEVTYEMYFRVVTLISDAGGIVALVEAQ
ncbi:MAG: biopolymer transporter ExbD [Verrucomicrobia bacterium]|nr:biopolymer transporter ExbD [Verrucomicrobiota bacterium]MCH8511606.1 biopolymer transporter ExbD [Kiritimatiellia bacterium]